MDNEPTESRTFDNVACPVCSCVCDDLQITVSGQRIVRAEGACQRAEPWYLNQDTRQPQLAEIEGQPVALPVALERAAALLRAARSPLIFGLANSSTEGQRAAVRLAERLGATIDTTASADECAAMLALQTVGVSTCTLGEVKNRADLIVFWGCDPVETHPRLLERYAVEPPGLWVPDGRRGRTVIVLDDKPTATSERADQFLPLQEGQDFEALWTLRSLLRGETPPTAATGVPLPLLADLVQRLKTCRFGIIFFGTTLGRGHAGQRTVEALFRLVSDLNDYTRFYARGLRSTGGEVGAENVLAWQTGYPFAVNFAPGYPRHNAGEFSAANLLEAGEVDACVLVGSEKVARLSPAATTALRQLPTVLLESPMVEPAFPATIRFTTAVYGVHLPGTAYRMDEVPIPLRALLPARYPSDALVLRGIEDLLG